MDNRLRYIKAKKGQSDTVFEVLITVILLMFVLGVGAIAMSSLSNTKCSKSIDIAMGDLKLAIEKAANSSLISTDFLFDLPYCFGSDANVYLLNLADPRICSTYCPGASERCYMLEYVNDKDKVSQTRHLCVQMSPMVQLSSINCSSIIGYTQYTEPIPPSLGTTPGLFLKPGKYKISSQNLSMGGDLPTICFYKKGS